MRLLSLSLSAFLVALLLGGCASSEPKCKHAPCGCCCCCKNKDCKK
jgi:hypothetical protein